MATTKKNVTRSAQISLSEVTVDEIVAGATAVGAPTSARVSTGSGVPTENMEEYLPYSVTYSWTDKA